MYQAGLFKYQSNSIDKNSALNSVGIKREILDNWILRWWWWWIVMVGCAFKMPTWKRV